MPHVSGKGPMFFGKQELHEECNGKNASFYNRSGQMFRNEVQLGSRRKRIEVALLLLAKRAYRVIRVQTRFPKFNVTLAGTAWSHRAPISCVPLTGLLISRHDFAFVAVESTHRL